MLNGNPSTTMFVAGEAAGPPPAREGGSPMTGSDTSQGSEATDPRQIPARGWWEVAKRVAEQLSSDHVPVVAAGVAFFSFLAIFPAIAGFVILYGMVADPATVGDQ